METDAWSKSEDNQQVRNLRYDVTLVNNGFGFITCSTTEKQVGLIISATFTIFLYLSKSRQVYINVLST